MANVARPIYHKLEEENVVHTFDGGNLPVLEIKGEKYKARHITFCNSVFVGSVHFDTTNLGNGLIFQNCVFNHSLKFTSISAKGYDVAISHISQNLIFKNCKFIGRVMFEGNNSIERDVVFENSTFEKGLAIQKLTVSLGSLILRECTINDTLDLSDVTTKQDISIAHCILNTKVRIEGADCATLTILGNNEFNEDFHVRGGKYERGIVFNDGIFRKEIYLNQPFSEKGGLHIFSSEFERAFFVNFHRGKSKPQQGLYTFYLKDAKFNNGIYINGTEDLFAEYPFVESIEIEFSPELKGDIAIRNLNVGIIALGGYNNSANLLLEHLFVNQLKIKALINNAGLIFSHVMPSHETWVYDNKDNLERENAIYISNTNFGKAQFFQVDFSGFKTTSFSNNIITDISTSLVKWFSPQQLDKNSVSTYTQRLSETLKSKKDLVLNGGMVIPHKQKRKDDISFLIKVIGTNQEIFRQLKLLAQKQANNIEFLKYNEYELKYQRKIIKYRAMLSNNWKVQIINCNERIILWFASLNNFGQNWIKALIVLLFVALLCYIPIGFLTSEKLDYTHFATTGSDLKISAYVLLENFRQVFVLLNPAHRITDITENKTLLNGQVYFWDLFSRVFISIFIFQLIKAFRKFSN